MQISKIFKDEGLQITADTNLTVVDFLDITMNLEIKSYSPYIKPNSTPLYVHTQSNHPPVVIENLPKMIERRISDISCNKDAFDKVKDVYNDALKKSGHKHTLNYQEKSSAPATNKKRRRRAIIWFNPPYNDNVKTNIGKKFFKILHKNFPPGHELHKILNKNTIKLSYSCMQNVQRIIKSINQKVLSSEDVKKTPEKTCNCRKKEDCPLQNQCLTKTVVYKASVKTEQNTFIYFGTAEGEFKTRFNNHSTSFKHEKNQHKTELSKKIWELKNSKEEYKISWEIAKKAFQYDGGRTRCDLCLTEKLLIITNQNEFLLNKRNELISKCRHNNKFLLKSCL